MSNIQKVKNEQDLIDECKEIHDTLVVMGSVKVLWGYWEIGNKFIEYEAEGWIDRIRGEATVKKVAEEINTHFTLVYASVALASKFATRDALQRVIDKRKKSGLSVSWSVFRNQVLPQNAGMSKPQKKEETLSRAEYFAGELEELTSKIAHEEALAETVEDQQMMRDVRQALTSTLEDSKEKLKLAKPVREQDRGYIDWIKTQDEWACIMTGEYDPAPDPHHLRTVGARGSDFDVIPLSREMHGLIETPGFWTTDRLMCLFNWAYKKNELDQRYLTEKENLASSPP